MPDERIAGAPVAVALTSEAPVRLHVATAGADDNSGIDGHVHYSQRSPWLRAFVLGANDGLVSSLQVRAACRSLDPR